MWDWLGEYAAWSGAHPVLSTVILYLLVGDLISTWDRWREWLASDTPTDAAPQEN